MQARWLGLWAALAAVAATFGAPPIATCLPLPAQCTVPATCGCLSNVLCGSACMPTIGGGLEVKCNGTAP